VTLRIVKPGRWQHDDYVTTRELDLLLVVVFLFGIGIGLWLG